MTRIIFLILLFLNVFAINAQTDKKEEDEGEVIVKTAMRYVGIPYKLGKSDPKSGFDCSGFTSFIFKQRGYNLSRSAINQYSQGQHVSVKNLRIGDLVFFRGRKNKGGIGHVGIVTHVFDNSFKFIHSSSKGVDTTHSTMSYYSTRFVGAKRIIMSEDK